jgi:uncharacterized protein (TIGR03435 family)
VKLWGRWVVAVVMLMSACGAGMAQDVPRPAFDAFEVATIKPVDLGLKAGRGFGMNGTHRWGATNFTLEALLALGFDVNPRAISGGPEWIRTQPFVITAVTPGDVAPDRLEQMRMLRALLVERFGLKYHRVEKTMEIYELTVAKGGPNLKAALKPDDPPHIVGVVYPTKVEVPAKSVTMADFVAMLQRATLDRPTVDRTGLTGKYDFDLVFAPDASLYGGALPAPPADAQDPPLFAAVQEQLGLKLTARRGLVSTIILDEASKPLAD